MQSYNEFDEIIRSKVVEGYKDLQEELKDPEVNYVKVGNLLSRGNECEINGLRYRVIMSNPKKKRLTLELV